MTYLQGKEASMRGAVIQRAAFGVDASTNTNAIEGLDVSFRFQTACAAY